MKLISGFLRKKCEFFVFFLALTSCYGTSPSDFQWKTNGLSFKIESGQELCFYEEFGENETVGFEYKITQAAPQDSLINFQLSDPRHRPLYTQIKKSSAKSSIKTGDEGVYRVCFDNEGFGSSSKVVHLKLSVPKSKSSVWDENKGLNLAPEDDYGMRVHDLNVRINNVRNQLIYVKESQAEFREVESTDRFLIEKSFERINFYSSIYLVLTLVIMVAQVFTLRNFFAVKSTVRRPSYICNKPINYSEENGNEFLLT